MEMIYIRHHYLIPKDTFTYTMKLISRSVPLFVLFYGISVPIPKGKVAEERGLMVCSRLIQILMWKIQLSCFKSNRAVQKNILMETVT